MTSVRTRHRLSTSTRNETRALTVNPPNSAQLEGTHYHSPSYIWVRAVVW